VAHAVLERRPAYHRRGTRDQFTVELNKLDSGPSQNTSGDVALLEVSLARLEQQEGRPGQ
jgi:hypothetical protein